MKNRNLLKTNLHISLILIIGFVVIAVLGYQANYISSLKSMEQVSSLSAEGIYYQLTTTFTKPVNVSLTMANDSLLRQHLEEENTHLDDAAYAEATKEYLNGYKEKYGFDAVFLVSAGTRRYYNFNGVDRILKKGEAENEWYDTFLESDRECALNVDNDEVAGAENEITVFVNCKVRDKNNQILGVVGVGIRVNSMKELLQTYEKKYNLNAFLVDEDGVVQISTMWTGYEHKDWFETYDQEGLRQEILGWDSDSSNLELWTNTHTKSVEKSYIVTRRISELSWNLVVMQDTGILLRQIKIQIFLTFLIMIGVIAAVLVIVTLVMRKYNERIVTLAKEKQETFKTATEQMYDHIYEINISQNRAADKRAEEYFKSLGAGGLCYDEVLYVISEKQIKEEFRKGYIETLKRENVIRQFESGRNHLRYDFMMTKDGKNYFWMRIDAHIFCSEEDNTIHMFTYRKNIDQEKKQELRALTDDMTGFYSKVYTEQVIDEILKKNFGEKDILGRVGGDEFAALLPVSEKDTVKDKAQELSRALCRECRQQKASWQMTASIGIALAPQDGTDFQTLYKNADIALYQAKKNGRNGFFIYTAKE